MAKTYIQLVNSVLKRLRVTQVVNVSDTEYSAMIGEFVNDAKQLVEDAWPWQSLQRSVTFNLTAGVRDYDLSSTSLVGSPALSDRARLLIDPDTDEALAFDISSDTKGTLDWRPIDWIRTDRDTQNPTNTQAYPMTFGIDKQTDHIYVRLNEQPTQTRTWKMYFCDPSPDLSANSDTLYVPERPVILLATLYALNERGEEIGEAATIAENKFNAALADAISYDAQYQPRKADFRVV